MSDEKPKCSCGNGSKVIIYSCSGSSNVGQLANEVTVELARAGKGSMGCLVGLSANISTMVQNAKAADALLVVDGCNVKCGSKVLERAGLTGFDSVVIVEMGIVKNHDLRGDREIMPELFGRISARLAAMRPMTIREQGPSAGCGCD